MSRVLNRRDANESELVAVWQDFGALWIPMTRDTGFDGVLVYRGLNHIVEIKNPARKWELTDAEKKRKAEVEAAGGAYNIVQTKNDALRLLGF